MNFTNEQLAKAKAAKSAEELLALAKENGIEISEEEAAKYFAELNKEGELADDELGNVSGGCGDDNNDYDGHNDPNIVSHMLCGYCGYRTDWSGKWESYETFDCPKCHAHGFGATGNHVYLR